jgi:hypothetical protein
MALVDLAAAVVGVPISERWRALEEAERLTRGEGEEDAGGAGAEPDAAPSVAGE